MGDSTGNMGAGTTRTNAVMTSVFDEEAAFIEQVRVAIARLLLDFPPCPIHLTTTENATAAYAITTEQLHTIMLWQGRVRAPTEKGDELQQIFMSIHTV